MNYYIFDCDTDIFDSLKFENADDYTNLHVFDGRSLQKNWQPFSVILYKMKKRGNFYYITGHVPILDEKAVEALKPLLEKYVEILPIHHNISGIGNLYAINVLPVLDCLDFERADVKYFKEGGIMSIWSYAFRDDVIGDTPIFRIREQEINNVYVSDLFREKVESAGLEGLTFKKL